jgi:hypothetical protein
VRKCNDGCAMQLLLKFDGRGYETFLPTAGPWSVGESENLSSILSTSSTSLATELAPSPLLDGGAATVLFAMRFLNI